MGPRSRQAVQDEEVSQLAGEQEADELFGLPPEGFVAARDDLARRLRKEGDAEAAAGVKALRRPTLSAWAVNQLARGRGPELERLLAAGERLRAAHQAALAGEGAAELRAAARAEREAVSGLVEAALQVLQEAGHPVTDTTRDRVAATLHAAAADPAAAELVRHGRLTSDLDPSGFGTPLDTDADAGPANARSPGRLAAGDGKGKGRTRVGREAAAAAATGEEDVAAARARRKAAIAARDEARRRARLAADRAVLATRHAERLGRLADQAEREAARARANAAAAIETASGAREHAAQLARELHEAEDRIPAEH